MKKRTLSIWLVTIIAILAVMPVGASGLSNLVGNVKAMFWGVTKFYSTPKANFRVTERLSKDSSNCPELDFVYWNGQKPFYGDSILDIGILIKSGTPTSKKFRAYITDSTKVINISNEKRAKKDKWDFGGLRLLDGFEGKYGFVSLDAKTLTPGDYDIYVAVEKDGNYENFGEDSIPIRIGYPLDKTIGALQNAPDEILAQWGLVATYEDVVQSDTSSKASFRLEIDGQVRPINVWGKPRIGRFLGFFSDYAREAVAEITDIQGETVSARWVENGRNISAFKPGELTPAWVVWGEVHSTKGDAPLTAEQEENLKTYPSIERGMILEMAQSPTGVKHLKEKYRKGMSRKIMEDYQNWTAMKHDWTLAPTEMWMPEQVIKKLRVIRVGSGVPAIAIHSAAIETVNRAGFGNGIMGIFAQMARRPDRFNLSAEAYAESSSKAEQWQSQSQWQQQDQNQNQDQSVQIDP